MREQSDIAVNQSLRTGGRNDLQHLVLFLVLCFARYRKGNVILARNVHIRLNHRLDNSGILHALGLGEQHFLINYGTGGYGHDSVLLLDVLCLDYIIYLRGDHGNVGYVSVGNHAQAELTHIRVLHPDFAAAVNASDKLYLPVGNIN